MTTDEFNEGNKDNDHDDQHGDDAYDCDHDKTHVRKGINVQTKCFFFIKFTLPCVLRWLICFYMYIYKSFNNECISKICFLDIAGIEHHLI